MLIADEWSFGHVSPEIFQLMQSAELARARQIAERLCWRDVIPVAVLASEPDRKCTIISQRVVIAPLELVPEPLGEELVVTWGLVADPRLVIIEMVKPGDRVCPACGNSMRLLTARPISTWEHCGLVARGDGTPANFELRMLRVLVHQLLDQLWSSSAERSAVYAALAVDLGLDEDDCHVRFFDSDRCHAAKHWALRQGARFVP